MLEYVFYDAGCIERFAAELAARQLPYSTVIEPMQGGTVFEVDEPLADNDWDALDDLYDVLNAQDQQIMEAGGGDAVSVAGLYLRLADGSQTIARVDPVVMNRMLQAVTMDEFNAFLEAVVRSVETPDDSAICKIHR